MRPGHASPRGNHEFDHLCTELGIEHRLTPPKSPQTNGMVERFNGRIDALLKINRFDSALDLEQTLMRYVALYNTQLPQSVLEITHTMPPQTAIQARSRDLRIQKFPRHRQKIVER